MCYDCVTSGNCGAPLLLVVATIAAVAFCGTPTATAAEPKRVLLVHSFSSGTPPFTVESTAFETELVDKMGERVDLDEVSLDMARYADSDMQEAIVEYLQKRQAKWKPDLVVPFGAPASIFVANYRDRLFPETPILYASADRRLLPPGALEKNAAYIGQIYDIPGFLEDMLQIAPATKNIAVVVGATPLEHLWQDVFQKAAEPLANRINFTYYNDLSLDQMLQRVAKLPPNSYIFFLLLMRDASGVTHNADEALQRLHAVANAPINSIFNHQLGLGIVGGRLYQAHVSERKRRTLPFAFCTVNRLRVFLQNSSSGSLRVMTRASCSGGRSMRNSCRQAARSCSASRQFGNDTGRGS